MTLEQKKVELSKAKCPKCGKLNPVDVVWCIHCRAIIRRAT